MTYTIIVHLRASSLENAEKLREKLIEAASVYRKGKYLRSYLPALSGFLRNYSYYDELISFLPTWCIHSYRQGDDGVAGTPGPEGTY